MQCEKDQKASIMGSTFALPQKPQMILKHLFLSFLVAEPRRWNPLGAGETSMNGEAVLTCRGCWNWPFDMGKVRGITGFSDFELH